MSQEKMTAKEFRDRHGKQTKRPSTNATANKRSEEIKESFIRQCQKLEWGIYAEVPFHPKRKWRLDFVIRVNNHPNTSFAVEIEGGIFTKGRHVRGKGFMGDMKKYNEATRLGYRLYRFTPKQVSNGSAVRYMKEVMG